MKITAALVVLCRLRPASKRGKQCERIPAVGSTGSARDDIGAGCRRGMRR